MRIALLIDQLTLGGTELQMMNLMAGFARRGHSVAVRSLRPPAIAAREPVQAMVAAGVALDVLEPTARRPTSTMGVGRWLRDSRPDVLVASMSRAEFVATVVAATPGPWAVPVIGTRRYLVSARRESASKRLIRNWSARRLDGVIANSTAALTDATRNQPIAGVPHVVIPNIVGSHWFEVTTPQAGPPHLPCITTLANLRPQKGHDTLLRAIEILQRRGQPTVTRLVGSGALESTLRSQATLSGLDVQFLGGLSDPRAVLAGTDLFVHPSESEGMPNAVLEAMAVGCAIVATDVGGTGEALGNAGLLVPPCNPDALANAIQSLLASPDQRQQLGSAARHRARGFTLERSIDSHIVFFESVLEAGSTKG